MPKKKSQRKNPSATEDEEDMSGRLEKRRNLRSSTKVNSSFKWKTDRTVVGALEIVTDPDLDLAAPMIVHCIPGYDTEFDGYHEVWKKLNLRKEFIEAYKSIPPQTTCCGLVAEQDATIKANTPLMNKGWFKSKDKVLKEHGFRLSLFVWTWNNLAGKGETVIPMIRFHQLVDKNGKPL